MRATVLAVLVGLTSVARAAPPPVPGRELLPPARAAGVRLRVEPATAAAIVGGTLALFGASAMGVAQDDVLACRWCEPGGLDLRLRRELRWDDTAAAARASDVLFQGLPVAAIGAVAGLAAWDGGGRREIVEDVALVITALLVTDSLTTSTKHHTARLRPEPWSAGGPRVDGDLRSFFSGHTSRVFSAAAAATQVLRLRGRRGWQAFAIVAFGAAATTGWLRVAADQHWGTDVIAGAAVATAVGLGVPAIALRRRGAGPPAIALAPAPGGFRMVF